jgi:hypothetical protein
MSKRVLAILVAALLAVGLFSAVASAGVEGSFKFQISIKPQPEIPVDIWQGVRPEKEAIEAKVLAIANALDAANAQMAVVEGCLDEVDRWLDLSNPNSLAEVEYILTYYCKPAKEEIILDLDFAELLLELERIWWGYVALEKVYGIDVSDFLATVEDIIALVQDWDDDLATLLDDLNDIDAALVNAIDAADVDDEAATIAAVKAARTAIAAFYGHKKPFKAEVSTVLKGLAGLNEDMPKPKPPLPNEYRKFLFDFESILEVNFTISGLTLGNHIAMGLAGIEHYIFSLSTTIGALDLVDEFWFAAPYNKNNEQVGPFQFVKKRVTGEITIGGLSFAALVLFEDVYFDHPYTRDPALLGKYYGLGTVLTLSGQTVSGIGVESVTGICADPTKPNKVKKWSKDGRVNPLCALFSIPEDGGGKTPLYFEFEGLYLTGIQVGPLTLDASAEFRPFHPISIALTGYMTFMGVDLTFTALSENITTFEISETTLSLAFDTYFTVDITDANGNLILDAGDSIVVKSSIPIQGATFSNKVVILPPTGFSSGEFGMTIPVSIGKLTAKVTFTPPDFTMSAWVFTLTSNIAGVDFSISSNFTMTGLTSALITIGIPFSV